MWRALQAFLTVVSFLQCTSESEPQITAGDADGWDALGSDAEGEVCVPDRDGKECGDDGCGAICGTCRGGNTCDDAGQCAPVLCKTSKDCPEELVCLQETGQCVFCVGDEDCLEGERCGMDHECHASHSCKSDKDCKKSGQVCDKATGECVECLDSDGCTEEEFCSQGYCLPDVCVAGERVCEEDKIRQCQENGEEWSLLQTCTSLQFCEGGECVDCACEAASSYCDGDTHKVCAADCKSLQLEVDCAATDQHCFDGQCIPTVCQAGAKVCQDAWTVGTCLPDGMGYSDVPCPEKQYCEGGLCSPWACEPGSPMCVGTVATQCNALGSGPVSGGQDCSLSGWPCQDGQCVSCQPQCEGKQCGPDGCGGACGACEEGQVCNNGKCPPPGKQCDDGNDISWDGCTNGQISEFQVNSYTEGAQNGPPGVATFPDGRFAIAWPSMLQDASGNGVFGQLFASDGTFQGKEFQINTFAQGNQSEPALAPCASGKLIAVWASDNQDGSSWGVYGQRFGADGSKLGPEFQVNTDISLEQNNPSVACLDKAGFVVAYRSYGFDGSQDGIAGQLFDAEGAQLGAEFVVNGHTNGSQIDPDVKALADGGFVVAWSGCTAADCSGFKSGIATRLFTASGTPKGGDIHVNSWTDNTQYEPAIAVTETQGLIVVWNSVGQDGWQAGIFGQMLDAGGSKDGTEFPVNGYAQGAQTSPSVVALAAGGFVATWTSEKGGDNYDIEVQLFDEQAAKAGDYFLASLNTNGWQAGSRAASFPDGKFIIVWSSKGQDGSDFGIFAQRFNPDGTKVYK